MFPRALFLLALSLVAAAPDAFSATLTEVAAKDGKVIAVLNGAIAEGDAERLKATIRAANKGGRLVYAIRLNSPGGNLAEGVRLAAVIQQAKMATSVAAGGTCASACFIVFAAGSEKFVSHGSRLGVHGASDKSGRETPNSTAATVIMARVLKQLGVPPAIIGKMVTTPPSDMVWLSPDEMRSMGAVMTGKPDQTAPVATVTPQLPPEEPTQATKPKSWDDIVQGALALSRMQHGGKAKLTRSCQPELKVCTVAVHFKGKSDAAMIAKTTENAAGKVIAREVCVFNQFLDVRVCRDWDTGASVRDMKNSKGQWIKVDATSEKP